MKMTSDDDEAGRVVTIINLFVDCAAAGVLVAAAGCCWLMTARPARRRRPFFLLCSGYRTWQHTSHVATITLLVTTTIGCSVSS